MKNQYRSVLKMPSTFSVYVQTPISNISIIIGRIGVCTYVLKTHWKIYTQSVHICTAIKNILLIASFWIIDGSKNCYIVDVLNTALQLSVHNQQIFSKNLYINVHKMPQHFSIYVQLRKSFFSIIIGKIRSWTYVPKTHWQI